LTTSGTSATRRSPPPDSFGTAIFISPRPALKAGESSELRRRVRRRLRVFSLARGWRNL
jgi:hypothetical protein